MTPREKVHSMEMERSRKMFLFFALSLSLSRAQSLSLSLSPIPPLDQPVRFLLSFALNENIDFRASGIIFIEIRFIGLAKSFFL